jgi:flagellar protein FlgJ
MTDMILKPPLALPNIQSRNRLEMVRSQLSTDSHRSSDRQKLRQACAAMESLFLHQLMKEMRRTIPQSGFISGGKGEEIFTDMLDYQRAQEISAHQGLGIAEMLEKQLSANVPPSESNDLKDTAKTDSKDFADSADNHSKQHWRRP